MPTGNLGMPLDVFFELYEQNNKYYSVLLGENGDPAFASKLKNSNNANFCKQTQCRPKRNGLYLGIYSISNDRYHELLV
ncbi:hypothetical protein [Clostridium lacusfryxellense]|uniref:hypothetical protein n=1 Tax=Clostridium lacusfryxellense TaxID=205328 RepID=UPI001C0CA91D|nr:hypothetical protein [Clostridium lacusfryxellense]MBU3114416.1 hypothetical protein [Clostridium lacusfryxellense]